MEETAEVFSENGQQIVRLPSSIHFRNGHVNVRQDDRTGEVILSEPETQGSGDFEQLFQMLDAFGPAPEHFMLFLSDPLLESEPQDLFADEDDTF